MATYDLNGPVIVGTVGELSKVIGYTSIGGVSNATSITGNGSLTLGGSALTTSIAGVGCVSVTGSGTIGSSSSDVNNVLIGGANTTLYSSGNVCIRSSSATIRYQPSSSKLFIKDNPIFLNSTTTLSTPGSISSSILSGGFVIFTTTPGSYTLDTTTTNIRDYLLDSSGTTFIGTPRPYFRVTFQNTTSGDILITSGTGQTYLNNSSPYILRTQTTQSFVFWFTSSTTIDIETPSDNTTLTSAGGTTSLVSFGIGPSIQTKGLTSGTGISFTTTSTNVTIDNTGVTSLTGTANQITVSASTGSVTLSLPNSVTIPTSLTVSGLTTNSFLYSGTSGFLTTTTAPTNGQLLIGSTGSSPVAATLTQGSGITITNGAGTITVASSGVTTFSAGTTGLTPSSGTTGAVTLAGTVNVGHGGTGVTTSPVNGSLLIGSNAGTYSVNSLTSGTGMSIISGSGTISVGLLPAVGFLAVLTADTAITAGAVIATSNWSTSVARAWNGFGSPFTGVSGTFTAPTAGYYYISFALNVDDPAAVVSIYINSVRNISINGISSTGQGYPSGSAVFSLGTSAQAALRCNVSTTARTDSNGSGLNYGSWFSAYRLQ